MTTIRRQFSSEFKARVVRSALREDKTLAQLASEFDNPPQPDYGMEAAGTERLAEVFSKGCNISHAEGAPYQYSIVNSNSLRRRRHPVAPPCGPREIVSFLISVSIIIFAEAARCMLFFYCRRLFVEHPLEHRAHQRIAGT
jgi:transposase-like protein